MGVDVNVDVCIGVGVGVGIGVGVVLGTNFFLNIYTINVITVLHAINFNIRAKKLFFCCWGLGLCIILLDDESELYEELGELDLDLDFDELLELLELDDDLEQHDLHDFEQSVQSVLVRACKISLILLSHDEVLYSLVPILTYITR